ncbi:hypothetical protein PIB30_094033 [Stylosanthes scabra]|uniref:Uncharacterized protein n=1 Tax=Stylosanthes scabra TaxID=79078 RepID=A0ABU6QWP8_9FABA|nr:hypothetical protein [Stylosanthes scabra]
MKHSTKTAIIYSLKGLGDGVVTKTLSLYKDKEGHLNLNIKEEADIARGIDAYFADLNRFTRSSNPFRSDIDRSWFDMVYASAFPSKDLDPEIGNRKKDVDLATKSIWFYLLRTKASS